MRRRENAVSAEDVPQTVVSLMQAQKKSSQSENSGSCKARPVNRIRAMAIMVGDLSVSTRQEWCDDPLKPTDLALLLVNRQGNVLYVPVQGE